MRVCFGKVGSNLRDINSLCDVRLHIKDNGGHVRPLERLCGLSSCSFLSLHLVS